MTFLQAVYGSQYREITQKGRNGAKGRFNGNIFLTAFIFLILITIMGLVITFLPSFNQGLETTLRRIYPYETGKTIGMELAIPVFGLLYLIIAYTVGTEKNYNSIIEAFNLLPDTKKNNANKKVLVPFFIVLTVFFVMAMSSSF